MTPNLPSQPSTRRLGPLPIAGLTIVLGILLTALLGAASAEGQARRFELETVATGLDTVVAITHAGDSRVFLVAKEGRVFILRNGQVEPTPYLDIRDRVLFTGEEEGEQGLLSIAFHPNYGVNGYLFAAYTRRDGTGVISRFGVTGPNPDRASSGSERLLLEVPQPGANHNLNHLTFGPDGYLYISSGDGGYQPEPRCTPQEKGNLLGKLLRIDVDSPTDQPPYHSIPADNPFVGEPGSRGEIWALGLRNPWRFDFDSQTGDLWLADVGHQRFEELNFLAAGRRGGQNWGFKMMEGFSCRGSAANCSDPIPPCFDPAYSDPVLDYGHSSRQCAIIGGFVYRGSRIPELQGAYLAGDYCGATFLVHRQGGGFQREDLSNELFGLVTFGPDAQGEPYLLVGGTLRRIVGLGEDTSVAFESATANIGEGAGVATVRVRRIGGTEGTVSVKYETVPGSAVGGSAVGGSMAAGDFQPRSGTLTWADGDGAAKTFEVPIVDDTELEGNESFQVVLSDPSGAELGSPATQTWTILDNESPGAGCTPSATVLCLGPGGRFQVSATWRDFQGQVGSATAVALDPLGEGLEASGLMWFFTRDNMEILVKVLDACGVNGHRWVFFSAATSVEYTVRVLDTETAVLRTYSDTLGQASPATTDSEAFDCE